MAFNAHEVLEAAWKNGPDDERMLWQGLAQLAVGITHIQRGNVKGITLLRRASARLAQDDRPAPYAIDAAHLVAYADALIADLAAGAEIPPKRLRPRLVGRRTPIAWGLLRTRGAAQLIVEDDAERRDVVRAAASDAERDPTE